MEEAKGTSVTMECVTLETNNQGQWRVVTVERWPLLGSILRMIISGLLAISAILTSIAVFVLGWAVMSSGVSRADNSTERMASNIVFSALMLVCTIVVIAGIIVSKGIDGICRRECFAAIYATILGLSPILLAIYAVNFIGPLNDAILFLRIILMRISMEHFLYGALAFIWINGIAVLLAFAYNKLCIQESREAIHEDTESETETED